MNVAEEIYAKLLVSKSCKELCPDTLLNIAQTATQRYKKPKDALQMARSRLHAMTGAFITPDELKNCEKLLNEWRIQPDDGLLERILRCHASTRERMPLAECDALFERLFEKSGTPSRILDLACGIDPIYLGARGYCTDGVDISGGAVRLVNMLSDSLPVHASCADLLLNYEIPSQNYSHVLLFKLLPLLEQQKKGSALALLKQLGDASIIVSFPIKSLCGRDVGMEKQYSARLEQETDGSFAVKERFVTDNELFYILKRIRYA